MKILLTGAFGNIGRHLLAELLERGHQVRCFDVPTRENRNLARRLRRRAEVVWGDLRQPKDVTAAMLDQEAVIHLGFVIPKLSATGVSSEDCPDWAREINVGGTRRLLEAAVAQSQPPKFIFASSLHVYGRTHDWTPPLKATDPVHPIEHYAHHKVECEQMVRQSGLEWAVLRLPATLPIRLILDLGMFDVPLENRIEIAHGGDVGVAFANAVESRAVWGKTLLIGGGRKCQLYYREFVTTILEAVGVGMLPERAFGTIPYPTDWLDTTESQALLHYQQRCLEDYVRDLKQRLGPRRQMLQMFRPLLRLWLLNHSPYFKAIMASPA